MILNEVETTNLMKILFLFIRLSRAFRFISLKGFVTSLRNRQKIQGENRTANRLRCKSLVIVQQVALTYNTEFVYWYPTPSPVATAVTTMTTTQTTTTTATTTAATTTLSVTTTIATTVRAAELQQQLVLTITIKQEKGSKCNNNDNNNSKKNKKKNSYFQFQADAF